MKRRVSLGLALLFSLWTVCAHAAPLSDQERTESLEKAAAYLNGLSTVTADFMQTSSDGTVGYGKFFLKRPGKLRWQYEPPVPVLIVVSGNVMSYQDFELDQVSRVSADSSLAAFLTRATISWRDKDIVVKTVAREAGALRITVRQKDKEQEGALTLIFDETPFALRKMEVVDAMNKTTSIAFSNVQTGQSLADKLFYIDEVGRSERRKKN